MKKIYKITTITLLFVIIFPLFSGCWDSRELDAIAIVTAVGLDAAEDDKVTLLLQIGATANAATKGTAPSSEKPYDLSELDTESIAEGLFNIRARNSRQPFLHHTQMLIVGREQAMRGVKDHLDVFLREHEMRLEVWMLVADEAAKDILQAEIFPEQQSAVAISQMIERSQKMSADIAVTLLKFVLMMEGDAAVSYAPILSVEKQNDQDVLIYKGLAIFKDGKMVGEIDFEDTKAFSWTTKKMKTRILNVETEKGSCVFDVSRIKNKKKVNAKADGSAIAELELYGEMDINEIKGFSGMTLEEIIGYLEEQAQLTIQEEILDTYHKLQQMGADIFQFFACINKHQPKIWKKLQNDWENIFEQMPLKCNIKMKIKDSGKISESLVMKDEG